MSNGVIVHGNRPKDLVWFVESFPIEGLNHKATSHYGSVGGISNVSYGLHRLHPDIPCRENPVNGDDTAMIIVNTKASTRTSLVKWSKYQDLDFQRLDNSKNLLQGKPIIDIKWHHFAYIDILNNLLETPRGQWYIQQIKKNGGILSADIAGVGLPNTSLDIFDYVFMSFEDGDNLIYHIAGRDTTTFIYHDPDRIQVGMSGKNISYETTPSSVVSNPLGAGDFLAACIIGDLLENPDPQELNLEDIYIRVQGLLEEQ